MERIDGSEYQWHKPGASLFTDRQLFRSNSGHGAYMVGAAAGGVNGIARAADIVVVRLPVSWHSYGPQFSVSTIMDALRQILFDIKSGDRHGKAVINMSWGMFFDCEGFDVCIIVTVAYHFDRNTQSFLAQQVHHQIIPCSS